MTFEEWSGGADDETLYELYDAANRKYKMFLLISLIPIVNWITMGCAIFAYNNKCFIKSRGRSTGNGLWRLILMVYAFIIPPLLVVKACASIEALGNAVLGWRNA